MAKERLNMVWNEMKQRCTNSKHHAYKYYGGRGIMVCEEWEKYKNFKQWALSSGYNENAKRGECTLDRIDVNGNYEPSNCRWASIKEQNLNKRSNVHITARGETHTITEWSEITGMSFSALYNRYRTGWEEEDIVSIPVKPVKVRTAKNDKPKTPTKKGKDVDTTKEWYSLSDLQALGYGSRRTILYDIYEGDFAAGNPGGGKWLIKKSEYDEWLQTRNKRRRRNRWQMCRHSR